MGIQASAPGAPDRDRFPRIATHSSGDRACGRRATGFAAGSAHRGRLAGADTPAPSKRGSARTEAPGRRRPEVAKAHPPLAKTTGLVELSTTPTTEVLFEGKGLGSTPVEVSLPAGDVALTFVNSELSLRRTMTVRVPAGGRAQQSIAFKKGKIAVDVTPWADVYIGDRKLGTTPLFPRELYEGTYTLRLVNPDLKAIKILTVTIEPGSKPTLVREQLP